VIPVNYHLDVGIVETCYPVHCWEKKLQPLGVILCLEDLGKEKKYSDSFIFVAVNKYVTRNMKNYIFEICNNAMGE
jgi:hypothetical protein